MASGLAGHSPLTPKHKDWEKFQEAFTYVLRELAKMIARDGEGATRLIEAHVDGVISQEIANQVAKAIVGSNLVKTAIFGREANWGRILCAAGYTNPSLDPELVDLYLGEIPIVKNGTTVPYNEAAVNAILQQEKVRIHLSLHQGEYSATAWGCDLTYDYVKINASYRT
jgi:glutamate N-acetyltransferase/amino-acid N-acetyltransferase